MAQEQNKRTFWEKISRFLLPIKNNKKRSLFLFCYSVFQAFYSIYKVILLEKITIWLENRSVEDVHFWLIGMLLLILIVFLGKIFMKPYVFYAESWCKKFLDEMILVHLMWSSNTDLERIGTGRMMSLVQKWVWKRTKMIMEFLWPRTIMLATLIFSLTLVVHKSPIIFLLTIFLLIFAYLWIRWFSQKALDRRRKAKDLMTSMDRMYVKWFMSKFEIQQNNGLEKEVQERDELYDQWTIMRVNEKIQQAYWYDVFMLFSSAVYMALVTYIAAMWVLDGTMQFSDFVVLTGLAMMVQSNLFSLQMELRSAMDDAVDVEKLRDMLDWLDSIDNRDSWDIFSYMWWDIELKNVSFSYAKTDKKDSFIFEKFSLNLQWWTKTAFVWPSGSGKSTLVKIIAGFIAIDSGKILVDGQYLAWASWDKNNLALSSYYTHVWCLTQEPSVFDGTVRENLFYGMRSTTDQDLEVAWKIEQAIRDAQCDFIYDLPDWLDTEIGERWIRLSWGQRQRLAIAKIFLKNPEIVILDEPTSALDSESEEAVTQAMTTLFKWRTVLIIAHRLQTVKNADRIIYLNEWEIVEEWSHVELMQREGKYYKMVELQSGF